MLICMKKGSYVLRTASANAIAALVLLSIRTKYINKPLLSPLGLPVYATDPGARLEVGGSSWVRSSALSSANKPTSLVCAPRSA